MSRSRDRSRRHYRRVANGTQAALEARWAQWRKTQGIWGAWRQMWRGWSDAMEGVQRAWEQIRAAVVPAVRQMEEFRTQMERGIVHQHIPFTETATYSDLRRYSPPYIAPTLHRRT